MSNIKIKSIHIYPIKSLKGIELSSSEVERRGLKYDRRWMLVDEQGRFISQRENHQLALLKTSINQDILTVTDLTGSQDPLTYEMSEPDSEPIEVSIWDDQCLAKPLDQEVNEWFSRFMGKSVRLVYMHDESNRPADPRYAISKSDQVSFADGYPILILSQASLDLLSEKVGETIPANRFRPNILIDGLEAHAEDELRKVSINQVQLAGVKPCARCVMITIDQQTGEKGKEPMKTLNTYRKKGNKILFGYNFIPTELGEISVGDTFRDV